MCWSTIHRGLDAAIYCLPYVMQAGNPRRPTVNYKQIFQSLIQSAVLGAVLLYGMVLVLDGKIIAMEAQVVVLTAQFNAKVEKLEKKIDELNNEIWSLRLKVGK